jgi:hypothetical protein
VCSKNNACVHHNLIPLKYANDWDKNEHNFRYSNDKFENICKTFNLNLILTAWEFKKPFKKKMKKSWMA